MKENDSLDSLLREWKSPEPAAELDRRIISAYRSAMGGAPIWSRFWTMRVAVPAPVLVAAVLAICALLLWLRPTTAQPSGTSGALTRINVTGFQPLPDGKARVVPAMEVRK